VISDNDESTPIKNLIGMGVKKKTRFRAQLDRLEAASDIRLATRDRIHLEAACRESLSDAEIDLNQLLPGIYNVYGIEKCLKAWLNRIDPQIFLQQAAVTWLALDYYHARQFQPVRFWKNSEGAEALKTILVDRLRQFIQANLSQILTHMAAMLALPNTWLSTSRWSQEIKAKIEQQGDFKIEAIHFEINLPPGGLAWIDQVTHAQWNILRKQIDAGNPWPIILLGYTLNPHRHKTVVAYGYHKGKDGIGKVFVYDPICQQSGQHIQINFRKHPPVLTESCIHRHTEPVFGFFVVITRPLPRLNQSGMRF
jgi:hypothetical protein